MNICFTMTTMWLQKHLEKQHTKEERDNAPIDLIKCTTCDALFYSQRAYQNHNMYHKPDDLYVTSEQQRLIHKFYRNI